MEDRGTPRPRITALAMVTQAITCQRCLGVLSYDDMTQRGRNGCTHCGAAFTNATAIGATPLASADVPPKTVVALIARLQARITATGENEMCWVSAQEILGELLGEA
jgi:hypothetical protein